MKLRIETAQGSREYVARDGAVYVVIGSRPIDDIHLPDDPAVSDPHARLERLDRWTIADQVSATGTLVNGQTTYTADLAVGDVIQVGAARITVLELDGAPARRAEPARPAPKVVPFQPIVPSPVRSGVPAAFVAVVALLVAGGAGAVYFLTFAKSPEPASMPPLVGGRPAPEEAPAPETPKPPPREAPPIRRPPPGMSAARGKELEAALKTIADGVTEETVVSSLRELETVEAECARETQHGLRHPLERTRTIVEQAVMIEMQRRYGRDSGDIYQLMEKSQYRGAKERLELLDAHLNQTPTHEKLARRMQMDTYLKDQPLRIEKGNEEFVARTLAIADENLGRRQYAFVAEQLALLGAQAVLTKEAAQRLQAETAHWESLAAKQKEGGAEAPIPPFDARKNRPPAAPKNGLLPQGEATTAAAQRALDKRLDQALKTGTIVGAVTTHHGREATVEKPDDWRMKLRVRRPHAGAQGEMVFVVRYALHQLPAATRLALQATLTQTRDELLALVLYAFANGLMDDAARVACTLWKADNSVKADLDALLAVKLRIAVPEGGFVERDGRLVPK